MTAEMMRSAMVGMAILVAPAFLICLLIAILAYRRRNDADGSGEDGPPNDQHVPVEPTSGRHTSRREARLS
jgi:hypothetical protein